MQRKFTKIIRLLADKDPETLKRSPVKDGRSMYEMYQYVMYVLVAL